MFCPSAVPQKSEPMGGAPAMPGGGGGMGTCTEPVARKAERIRWMNNGTAEGSGSPPVLSAFVLQERGPGMEACTAHGASTCSRSADRRSVRAVHGHVTRCVPEAAVPARKVEGAGRGAFVRGYCTTHFCAAIRGERVDRQLLDVEAELLHRLGSPERVDQEQRNGGIRKPFPCRPTSRAGMIQQNASPIAGLLLTTEAVVTEKPEPTGGAPARPGGGMGDTY